MTPEEQLMKETIELKEHLKLTEDLLEEQYRIMDLIPPCPAHGGRCVPHAVEWIRRIITLGNLILRKEAPK